MSRKEKSPQEEGGEATFEQSLQSLEKIVEKLEGGELSLDESMQLFAQAVIHARRAETLLNEVEGKVEKLLSSSAAGASLEVQESDLLNEE